MLTRERVAAAANGAFVGKGQITAELVEENGLWFALVVEDLDQPIEEADRYRAVEEDGRIVFLAPEDDHVSSWTDGEILALAHLHRRALWLNDYAATGFAVCALEGWFRGALPVRDERRELEAYQRIHLDLIFEAGPLFEEAPAKHDAAFLERLAAKAKEIENHPRVKAAQERVNAAGADLCRYVEELQRANPGGSIFGGPLDGLDLSTPAGAADATLRILAMEDPGPRPWKAGDARVRCAHCQECGRLYPASDLSAHRELCPVVRAVRVMRSTLGTG